MEHYSIKHSHGVIISALLFVIVALLLLVASQWQSVSNINTLTKRLRYTRVEFEREADNFLLAAQGLVKVASNHAARLDFIYTNGVGIHSFNALTERVNYLIVKDEERNQKRGWLWRKR